MAPKQSEKAVFGLLLTLNSRYTMLVIVEFLLGSLPERRVQPQVPKGNKIDGSPPFKNLASWPPDRKVKNRQHGKQSVPTPDVVATISGVYSTPK